MTDFSILHFCEIGFQIEYSASKYTYLLQSRTCVHFRPYSSNETRLNEAVMIWKTAWNHSFYYHCALGSQFAVCTVLWKLDNWAMEECTFHWFAVHVPNERQRVCRRPWKRFASFNISLSHLETTECSAMMWAVISSETRTKLHLGDRRTLNGHYPGISPPARTLILLNILGTCWRYVSKPGTCFFLTGGRDNKWTGTTNIAIITIVFSIPGTVGWITSGFVTIFLSVTVTNFLSCNFLRYLFLPNFRNACKKPSVDKYFSTTYKNKTFFSI